MEKLFKYEIENLAPERPNIIETHITIWEDKKQKSFYTGLYTNNKGYANYTRGLNSTEVMEYAFNKTYGFKQKWIEIILYDGYVAKLVDPESKQMKKAKDQITSDISDLGSFRSFMYSYEAFLLDKFINNIDDPSEDIEDPVYDDYARYHRLLDCLLDYQLRYKTLVLKESGDKLRLLEFVSNYSNGVEKFNLETEFLDFLSWSKSSKIDLLSEEDVGLISKLGL